MSMKFRDFAAVMSGMTADEFRYAAREESRKVCLDNRTKQGDKDSTDINVIVRRYRDAGLTPVPATPPMYGDMSGPQELQDALAVLQHGTETFSKLSATQREAFRNDPVQFVREAMDDRSLEKFQKLGLARKAEAAPPVGGTPPGTVTT